MARSAARLKEQSSTLTHASRCLRKKTQASRRVASPGGRGYEHRTASPYAGGISRRERISAGSFARSSPCEDGRVATRPYESNAIPLQARRVTLETGRASSGTGFSRCGAQAKAGATKTRMTFLLRGGSGAARLREPVPHRQASSSLRGGPERFRALGRWRRLQMVCGGLQSGRCEHENETHLIVVRIFFSARP